MTNGEMTKEKERKIKEMEETDVEYEFAPFDPQEYCDFLYEGIEETCGADATHIMTLEYREEYTEIVRCDDHGFPMAVRARKERDLGHSLCMLCRHRTFTGHMDPNEPVGTYPGETDDGDEITVYCCEECDKEFDLPDLEKI